MLRETSIPAFVAPQTPLLSAEPPEGDGWVHEIKDGKYSRMVEACRKLNCRSALIDGEVIVQEAGGELKFAGTAFLTLSVRVKDELQQRIEKLVTERPPVPQRVWRKPQWLKPELRLRVRHLAGGDTLRHASVLQVL